MDQVSKVFGLPTNSTVVSELSALAAVRELPSQLESSHIVVTGALHSAWKCSPKGKSTLDVDYALHGRHCLMPPEIVPLFDVMDSKDSEQMYHVGLLRDAVDQSHECPVVRSCDAEGSKYKHFADSVHSALLLALESRGSNSSKPSSKRRRTSRSRESKVEDAAPGSKEDEKAPDVKKVVTLIEKSGKKAGLKVADLRKVEGQIWKDRKKLAVAQTRNGLGVVVPYDEESEVGYREPYLAGASLFKLLGRLDSAGSSANAEPKDLETLGELMNRSNIANDEGDFGTSLEVGMNVWSFSVRLRKPAFALLRPSYTLLGRHDLLRIAELQGSMDEMELHQARERLD